MKTILFTLLLGFAASAQATPFANGNAEHGKKLHASKCNACHAAKYNDDGSKMYLRSNRRVNSASHLAQQITACNSMLALDLFPEDEAALGAHLNRQFYKFK